MKPFWVTSLFGAASRKGIVELHYQDWSLQLETDQARKIAHDILEAAEAADQDAFIHDFFSGHMKLDNDATHRVFREFRIWREQKRKAS